MFSQLLAKKLLLRLPIYSETLSTVFSMWLSKYQVVHVIFTTVSGHVCLLEKSVCHLFFTFFNSFNVWLFTCQTTCPTFIIFSHCPGFHAVSSIQTKVLYSFTYLYVFHCNTTRIFQFTRLDYVTLLYICMYCIR